MTVRYTKIGALLLPVSTWSPSHELLDGTFPYIDLGAVDNDEKIVRQIKDVPFKDAPSRARQLVKNGDILVSTVRPNLNGIAKLDARHDGATASTGFCVLRPNTSAICPNYLFHWLKSPPFVAEMVRQSTGASYPAVSDRIIHSSLIPLPPLDEQRRIAAILDQADDQRRKRLEALGRISDLARANALALLGNPLTNPKEWRSDLTLGEVSEIVSGVTKGRKLNGAAVRSVPYLAVANVQDGSITLKNIKYIDATEDEIRRLRLRSDDLLLTEGGDPDKLGRGSLWSNALLEECIHQNHVFRVRVKSNEILPAFLNWLIGSERGKRYFLNAAKQTTGIASINMTQLRAFPLLVPPLEVQNRFVEQTAEIDTLKAHHRAHLARLDALFASLQHRAFRGDLPAPSFSRAREKAASS
ncbi:hypothetical protein MSC49_31470 [Methylosinus sp. C49]|uniref:restriction endonuclease subunit S n=1 Tax=Methylosinus sp. C49 TaxID=2699395 RepID=UPI0013669FAE|nr:restriction endonuclease subunit S [Methylosinus sp. C49]BBU63212.1 hypothetical protein MSC49_31470 [Methylosinus sp. C49]